MIELLDEHLSRLRAEITDPAIALEGLVPYLRTEDLAEHEREALFALPGRIPAYLTALENVITQTDDSRIRGFAGGIFAYVFNPIDILSADELGYLGYVEDAVICWKGLSMLRARFGAAASVDGGDANDATWADIVWGLLADDVQGAVDSFLGQFEAILGGVNF